jgi:subtilase family serine protease
MKICPFCREHVHEDATKCRYCASSLAPVAIPSKSDPPKSSEARQVVYIVDEGLVQFGKFVVAAVAIIAAIGAFLFGIDIKKADEDVHKIRDDVEVTATAAQKTSDEIKSATADLEKARQEANAVLAELHKIQQEGDRIFAAIKQGATSLQHGGADQSSASRSWHDPPELAKLYDFPAQFDGRGQTIGIIELAGGYLPTDLSAYFAALHVTAPEVTAVSVDGSTNSPGKDRFGADSEVTMNIEVAGAVAPGAKLVVYFAKSSYADFAGAVSYAIHDQTLKPSVIIVAWGGPESSYDAASAERFNLVLASAAALGITVVAAAGDGGTPGKVDFPASSPFVLACGGTKLTAAGGQIASEVAWNSGAAGGASQGGYSALYPRPTWQSGAEFSAIMNGHVGRGVPDVAASADPANGYRVYVHGQWQVIGGTGAAASVWGGFVARVNQALGRRVGLLNPLLYEDKQVREALRNLAAGPSSAGPVWTPTTGLGSPDGTKLIAALKAIQTH